MVIPTSIYTSKVNGYGVLFWRAVLTQSQADELLEDPNVAVVYQPCTDSCYDPTTELVMQRGAPDDLVVASQFPGMDFAWYRRNYIFHERAGRDVKIYIIDSGADLTHDVSGMHPSPFGFPADDSQEFTGGSNMASRTRWLHTNPEIQTDENDGGIHGTCMLARMGGNTLGVAKHTSPIIVRKPSTSNSIEYYFEGLRRVIEDTRGDEKPSVLSLSLYWPRFKGPGDPMFRNGDGGDAYDDIRRTMRDLLRVLIDQKVLPITGSGNAGAVSPIALYGHV